MDREVYHDPDSDRYLVPSERIFDNTADDLETIAVSKHSMSLLPQKEAIRSDLQPFRQKTEPLVKIWCVKMEDDAHQPDELDSQLSVMKTYLLEGAIQALRPTESGMKLPYDEQLEKVDREWGTRQKRSGRGQLPYPKTKLYAERGKVMSEQGRDRGL